MAIFGVSCKIYLGMRILFADLRWLATIQITDANESFVKQKTVKMYINSSWYHDGSNIVIENRQLLFRSGI